MGAAISSCWAFVAIWRTKQRLNILAQYIYLRIYDYGCILWQEFDHQLLNVGLEVCGRAGQDLAKQDISCVNIQIFLLEPSHSGEAEKLETFITYFEIRPPLYVFRDKYIYRADRPKLCFGQTCWQDILFKKGNGTNYVFLICKQTQDDPESSQIRWKNKLSQTHWQIPLATFSHFPQNQYLSTLLWLSGSISSPEI